MADPGQYIRVKDLRFTGRALVLIGADGRNYECLDTWSRDEEQNLRAKVRQGSLEAFLVDEARALASCHGYHDLIEHYYHDNPRLKSGRYSLAAQTRVWVERWRQACSGKGKVDCLFPRCRRKPEQHPGFNHIEWDWCMAKWTDEKGQPQWVMPVFAPLLLHRLSDHKEPEFVPTSHFCNDYSYYLHSCHTPHTIFPQSRKFKIKKIQNDERKDVTIVLHGFLHPGRLHHKYLKHVLGQGQDLESERDAERDAWAAWTGQVPHPAWTTTLAKQKTYAFSTIRYPSEGKFNKAHATIRPGVNSYLEKLKNLFVAERSPTIYLINAEDPDTNTACCMVNILGPANSPPGYSPFLSVRGISYDWQTTNPLIHVDVRSFFLKSLTLNESLETSGLEVEKFLELHRGKIMSEWEEAREE